MRRPALALGLALVLLGCAAGTRADDPVASGPACAVILSTNDLHGQLEPRDPGAPGGRRSGGIAALAAHFDSATARAAACPAFILSAGDLMQGTPISNLWSGESTIAAMNAAGYDAAAIGNHEFDWGVGVLRERIAQADFPFLGANIYERRTGEHPDWVRPYAILERAGVRVGVIGLTTESTPETTRPSNVEPFEFRDLSETLDRYVPEVRRRGADFVVALMHAGGFCERPETERGAGAEACEGEAFEELSQIRVDVDYAVTGHTHSRLRTEVRDFPVVQSSYGARAFGVGRLERDTAGRVRARIVGVPAAGTDAVTPDPAVAALVERYGTRVDEFVRRPVARLADRLDHGRGDYPLGRLIADAQRRATGADVAIMNNGGIRTDLGPGTVTYGDLMRVQPFGNRLVALRLPGRLLLAALEHALRDEGPDANVSGVTIRYAPAREHAARVGDETDANRVAGGSTTAGEPRVLSVALAGGATVRPDSTYSVVVNDFMAEGGSGYWMLTRAASSEDTGIKDLEALAEHLRNLPQPVEAPRESRWIAVESP